MRSTLSLIVALFLFSLPVFAGVIVNTPHNAAQVSPPFTLSADALTCSSQPVAAMGYSLDTRSNTTTVMATAIRTQVTASLGTHVLHVKAWGNKGASCVVDVSVTVVVPPPVTNVVVTSPINGATVTLPATFVLNAHGSQCLSQPVSAFGYSFDALSNTVFVNGQTISAQVTGEVGPHVLHVKSWGAQGSACNTDVAVTVLAAPPLPTGSVIPANAVAVKDIQKLTWRSTHDTGTPGTSTGEMQVVSAPSLSGSAKSFTTDYTGYGGERYAVSIGADALAKNFVYDTWLYVEAGSKFANIEMDMNQVMANGQTVIYGFQCSYWGRTWDYTANTGTPKDYKDVWLHSAQYCDPSTWTTNAWHHVQISYARDNAGMVTYKSVFLDSKEQVLNVTVPSAFALGWGQTLLTNFQVDGIQDGSAAIYVDNMTIYRW